MLVQGIDFQQKNGYSFADYSKDTGTLWLQLANATLTYTFTATIVQLNSPLHDLANCNPTVTGYGTVNGNSPTPVNITYNCNSIGRSKILLSVSLSGTVCSSVAYWCVTRCSCACGCRCDCDSHV